VTDPEPSSRDSAASARRRATDDPGVFLIPTEALPPGFAEKVEGGAHPSVVPRPAATVLLARDGARGPELLLLRRHGRSGFAAGAWVFPGGTVDEADGDPALAERIDGPEPLWWARRLEVEDPAVATGYVAAALREAFEETGIVLARTPEGAPPSGEGVDVARRALLSGVVGLREVAVTLGVRLDARTLAYVAHWITPEPEPRRYDTRFFLAAVPDGAVCVPHEAELVDAAWLTPAEAARRFEAGELHLLPPTIHTLRRLVPFRTVAEMLDALRDVPVPRILPVMRRRPDGVVIVLPESAGGGDG
jgi:8-oxo-dGTP pyrophosphatase MutT (NUDIX family)